MTCCSGCGGRVRAWLEAGWGFVSLGLALTIVAFLLGVVYFSIRAITTSLEHVDIVPTYATALLVCCVGILTLFLYKRRDAMITVPTLVLSIICILLTLASFLLLTTKVIQRMMSFRQCQYDVIQHKCFCQTSEALRFVYSEAASCHVIESNLLNLAYTQCALFMLAFLFSTIATALIAYTIHDDRKSKYLLEEEEISQEPEMDVVRIDNQRNPLIGRYRQLLSRQIVLPDGRFYMHGQISQNIRESTSTCQENTRDLDGNNRVSTDVPGDEAQDHDQQRASDRCQDILYENSDGNPQNDTNSVSNNNENISQSDTVAANEGSSSPNILWDGYCRRPETEVARLNRHLNDRAGSRYTGSRLGNPWSFQPILFPPDLSRVHSGHSRRRPRQRHRLRQNPPLHRGSHPYVAFVPVPFSLYRPNSFYGMGVTPFPVEPPPYLAQGVPPPPYSELSPAPSYTSRPISPLSDYGNNLNSVYENIDL